MPAHCLRPIRKSKCTVERSQIAGGHIDQIMMCPQKKRPPIRATRTGTYGTAGFTARLTMGGRDAERVRCVVVIDQAASHTGAKCR